MRRLMLYDRLGNPLGELPEADVFEAVLREEINGEHSLTITTTRVLDKGIRLLYEDGRSKWREFVVAGVDAEHASGNRAIGTYYCVWSVQQDLQGVTVSVMPGVHDPTTAALALTSLLSATDRWTRGTVTQTTTGGASMYDRSAWEALSVLVDVWGGEVDATITVSTQSGVTGRAVDLYAAQGDQTAKRRFDFGADLVSIKRTLADNPLFCRISPRGKGEQTDAGGYGRKITIASVNSGVDWLEYAPMVDVAKLPDGNGGYEYPTLIVENSDCETPADLKTWAQSVLAEYCTPKVSYEIDVVQAGIEGVDVSGVSLGDAVQVVDRKFSDDGIRIEGRVRSITTDLLNERDITIVIGDAEESISAKFANVDKSLAIVNNDLTVMSTADYIDNLLDRINTEINATGGYTYIVPGNGILTFDVAVADPLNPVEASQVVEVKGGSIRIANSRTAQGAWEWKSVFTSGHISADLITAINVTAGYIGSANGLSYWNLDSGGMRLYESLQLVLGATISYTDIVAQLETIDIGTIPEASTYNLFQGLYLQGSSNPSAAQVSRDIGIGLIGNTIRNPIPAIVTHNSFINLLTNNGSLVFNGSTMRLRTKSSTSGIIREIAFFDGESSSTQAISIGIAGYPMMHFMGSGYSDRKVYLPINVPLEVYSKITAGSLSVSGTKSRLVDTPNYASRLLYSYETPSPIFGDLGSGVIGEDGYCFVEIDDIFSETARVDIAYQVFLQKCGQGDLWVESKSSTHFVVRGTPGLPFDWELKARQTGFENIRLEDEDLDELNFYSSDIDAINLEAAYMSPIEEIESAYAEELGL